jgi:hypothetical protein
LVWVVFKVIRATIGNESIPNYVAHFEFVTVEVNEVTQKQKLIKISTWSNIMR